MAKWDEYGLKIGTSARDEVLILDSDTNTNKRITVGDIQEFVNGKMLEKENATLNTEAKTLIGAINEVDAKNDALEKDKKAIEAALENEKNERIAADSKEKSERQSEIDVERKRINNVYSNKLVTLDEIDLVTEEGFFVDALAVKELNSKLIVKINNAGAHNSIYRGKFLGNAVTPTQYDSIKAGTFEDLYIGDYWTIGGINYRIAAFDYYLNSGDTSCTTHHVSIVPDTCLYNAQMHNTSSDGYEGDAAKTTTGGYVGSDMYKSNLEQAKTTIKSAFSDHVLKHRIYLTNAVANGRASGGAWCDSEVDLMCEQMVYGSGIFSPVSDGSNNPANYRVEKSQLPLFQHEPSRICNRNNWWLRDVITASSFASVHGNGSANYYNASHSNGVRPAFCIS
jgi:hypothetical protein